MWVAFANAKATHLFNKILDISVHAIFDDQSFNDTLHNDIVSFEQLGPDLWSNFLSKSFLKTLNPS